jgi:hypothetical protein
VAKSLEDIDFKEVLPMTNYTEKVKKELTDIIKEMAKHQWLFVKNPNKDFTRKRKLDFEGMIKILDS